MASLAHSVEQEVFDREQVRITLALVPEHATISQRYAQMFPKPLPDDATLGDLMARVNACLGQLPYGVVNPLGSPTKISAATPLSNVRAYYEPKNLCKQVRRSLRQSFRNILGLVTA